MKNISRCTSSSCSSCCVPPLFARERKLSPRSPTPLQTACAAAASRGLQTEQSVRDEMKCSGRLSCRESREEDLTQDESASLASPLISFSLSHTLPFLPFFARLFAHPPEFDATRSDPRRACRASAGWREERVPDRQQEPQSGRHRGGASCRSTGRGIHGCRRVLLLRRKTSA